MRATRLAERPWISFDPATQMYRLIAAWFGQAGLNPRARMHLKYPEAISDNAIQSVLQTLGEFA